jgi:hypothetical protein
MSRTMENIEPVGKKTMSEEAQRIAIAEACGFTNGVGMNGLQWWTNSDGVHEDPPDYLNDLSAIHEAEKTIRNQFSTLEEAYWRNLSHVKPHAIFATATQRAEALLRTIGKWDETK